MVSFAGMKSVTKSVVIKPMLIKHPPSLSIVPTLIGLMTVAMTAPIMASAASSEILPNETFSNDTTPATKIKTDSQALTMDAEGLESNSLKSTVELPKLAESGAKLPSKKTETDNTQTDDTKVDKTQKVKKKTQPDQPPKDLGEPAKYDLEALIADPAAFEKYLNKAIAKKDWQTITQLMPYYKALTARNDDLVKFAEASVQQSQGKFKPIINYYQDQLEQSPDNFGIRLKLASALQANKQFADAKTQLLILQNSELPAKTMTRVERSLASIKKTEDWRFNVSVSSLRDVNINNAPDKDIQVQLGREIEQRSGTGLAFSASANKRINLAKSYYARVGGSTSLKGYWDASDYNNYLFTATTGIGYNTPKLEWYVSPFVTRRIYDEEPYSIRQGLTIRGSRWLYPKFKVTATAVLSHEDFDNDKDNRRQSDNQSFSIKTLYSKGSNESFAAGITTQHNRVPNTSLSNNELNSFNIGWNRQWPNRISTAVSASHSLRKYSDPAEYYGDNEAALSRYYQSRGGSYGSVRKDKTTSLALQVWNRDFTLFGFIPHIGLKLVKKDSNFAYYDDRNEESVTIVLTKSF